MKYTIEDIEQANPNFEVPENYFEELPLKIQKRLEEKKAIERFSIAPAWKLAFAASFIAGMAAIFLMLNDNPGAEEMLAEVPDFEIVAYLDQLEIDDYDLATAVGENSEILQAEDYNYLDGVPLEGSALDDLFIEYDLEEEI